MRIVIYVASAIILLSTAWVVFRVFVRRDYLQNGQLSNLPSAFEAVIFFTYGGFPIIYLPDYWPRSIVPPVFRATGIILLYGGLGMLLYCMLHLGIPASMGKGKRELNLTGPYKVTRNPQAIACGLYVVGFSILWPSCYALGWAILYAPLIHIMILTEEEHLLNLFGDEYKNYCRRVHRYIKLSKGSEKT